MLRSLILKAIDIFGINWLISYLYRNHIVIFMLHGVVPPHASKVNPAWTRHTQDEVETILRAYRRRYNFISMTDAVEMINGAKPWKKYCMVITIDDGYRNSLEVAYPIFEKHNVPMTIYVTANNIEKQQMFWVDKIDCSLHATSGPVFDLNLSKVKFKIDKTDNGNLTKNFNSCLALIKQSYSNDYDLLQDIDKYAESALSAPQALSNDELMSDTSFALITADELAKVPEEVTIGSHMMNHVRCTHIASGDLENELKESKAWIETHTGSPCEHFCYPNGDYDSSIAHTVCDTGYLSAVTTKERSNKKGDDTFTLHRFPFPHARSIHEANYRLSYNLMNQS